MRNFITGLLSVAIMTLVSSGMVQAQDTWQNTQNNQSQNQDGEDVVDVIQNSDEHTIFASLIEEANMVEDLRQEDSVTVIAPTDEAFNDMDGNLNDIRQNPRELETFVDNHIENGDERRTNTGNMEKREKDRNKDKKHKDNKEVLDASNGEVHSVDKVKKEKKDKQ